jgi:integrase
MNGGVSGHVLLRKGQRGGVYYLKYRLPDGRQVKERLGPAWTSKGRTPAGHYTRRMAEEKLQEHLADARRGTLAGMYTVGATFQDAAAEWLRYVEHDRDVKPSTLSDYRHMVRRLNKTFGDTEVSRVDMAAIDKWRAGLSCGNRTVHKYMIVLNGIFKRAMRVYGVPSNPMALIERPRVRQNAEIDVYSPAEVMALVSAATDAQDKALFLTAAFTGMRMGELLALRWQDVDFGASTIRVVRSFTLGGEGTPKSGKGRSVPMVPAVATPLAGLRQREHFTEGEHRVFCGVTGGHLDSNKLRLRYKEAQKAAGVRGLRFHDLRHTFGTRAVEQAESIIELKEWMGHSNVQTTTWYMHYKSKADAAERLAKAFT